MSAPCPFNIRKGEGGMDPAGSPRSHASTAGKLFHTETLHGMFNPAQVNLAADPEFFNDIHADVEQAHGEYFHSSRFAS